MAAGGLRRRKGPEKRPEKNMTWEHVSINSFLLRAVI
jgi:hypothetical protein